MGIWQFAEFSYRKLASVEYLSYICGRYNSIKLFDILLMKCIRLHLLLSALLLISVSAFAGPRSFRQAKQIAERQAALLGIVMDESAASQAKSFGFGDNSQKSQVSEQESTYFL